MTDDQSPDDIDQEDGAMTPEEAERRLRNFREAYEAAYGADYEGPDGIGTDCEVCRTLEATRKEAVENEETGRKRTVSLCECCWDKIDRYSRGEDVNFDDEIRLRNRSVDTDTGKEDSDR